MYTHIYSHICICINIYTYTYIYLTRLSIHTRSFKFTFMRSRTQSMRQTPKIYTKNSTKVDSIYHTGQKPGFGTISKRWTQKEKAYF